MNSQTEFDFDLALARVRDQPESSFSRVLFAAEKLFAKGEFAGVGIRDIANDVQINVSTLHFHWRNKETLYEGVCRYHASLLVAAVGTQVTGSTLDVIQIKSVISSLVQTLVRHPCIAPIAIQSLSGKDPGGSLSLANHDVVLYQQFSKHLKSLANSGSVARQFPQLIVLNVLYSTLLMFVDTTQQQTLLGSSLYQSKKLQSKVISFASRLLDLALHDERESS